jgi:DNA-binding MarR family transcriptional regulator
VHAQLTTDPTGIVLPALLSAARRPYGDAIRSALDLAGMADMPPRGAFVVGSVAYEGLAMHQLSAAMGISKQAVSQLVDTLVVRGYLDRSADPQDRRRIVLGLTPRGAAAAETARQGVAEVDRRLADLTSARERAATRRVLLSLAGLTRSAA